MKTFKSWLWLIPLALLMPLAQALLFLVRFGRLNESDPAGLTFLPAGLISGALLIYLLQRTENRRHKLITVAGYIVAFPVAFIAAFGSGLILPALIGVPVCGGLPWAAGAGIGYLIGGRWRTAE